MSVRAAVKPPSIDATPAPSPRRGSIGLRSVGRSHVGVVRTLNEDRYLERPDIRLWAVADGMGGHEAGDVAADLIIESLAQISPPQSGYGFLNAVCDGLQAVNHELLERAAALSYGALIGSTVAALLVYDDHYACVWAGDSRIYVLRDGKLIQLTHDHSAVQEMVDTGLLTPEQAHGHARSNIVTRAVGAGDPLELDVRHAAIEPGDVFLICSDGLTGTVTDDEIRRVLTAMPPERAADGLIALTLDRGARDNVTLVLISAEA
ncbi:PP2C family serine/threonine-protein phosphatase [Phenylobacterium sp.]|uniref:PP2C family protein-serine/threonine phosphatase n=1 Tax=Phenylobacterium sp. TaxID=1871053 RepID=UPI0035B1EA7D